MLIDACGGELWWVITMMCFSLGRVRNLVCDHYFVLPGDKQDTVRFPELQVSVIPNNIPRIKIVKDILGIKLQLVEYYNQKQGF